MGLPQWIDSNPSENIANTDVVLWHTFGVTHFPAPEDYPVMPAEPMTLLLRPRNFFLRNPALDVPPSFARSPSQVLAGKKGVEEAERDSVKVNGGGGMNGTNGVVGSVAEVVNGLAQRVGGLMNGH